MKTEKIIFGGGCFWCTEAVFKMIKGVISVEPGYAGGAAPHPTYEQISQGNTGHAEVIRVEFDPSQITFDTLLTVFFASHDSTTKDRQGDDVGPQYRSIILCTTKEQMETAETFIKELNSSSEIGAPITTEVRMLDDEQSPGGGKFHPAEDYHKNYYENNQKQPYCQIVINPKLKKVQEKFANLLKNG